MKKKKKTKIVEYQSGKSTKVNCGSFKCKHFFIGIGDCGYKVADIIDGKCVFFKLRKKNK